MKRRISAIVLAVVLAFALFAAVSPAHAADHPSREGWVGEVLAWPDAVAETIGAGWRWLWSQWGAVRYSGDPNGSAATSPTDAAAPQTPSTNLTEAICDPTAPPEIRYSCDPNG